jgi:hypothetical protein
MPLLLFVRERVQRGVCSKRGRECDRDVLTFPPSGLRGARRDEPEAPRARKAVEPRPLLSGLLRSTAGEVASWRGRRSGWREMVLTKGEVSKEALEEKGRRKRSPSAQKALSVRKEARRPRR